VGFGLLFKGFKPANLLRIRQLRRLARCLHTMRGGGLRCVFMNDLKFAVRQLLRNPGFTLVAVVTLALGIGANASIVTMIDTLAWKSVKARQPERLVGVFQHAKENPNDYQFFSFQDFLDLRTDKSVFSDVAAFNMTQVALREGELVRRVTALVVSANYFTTVGIPPLLGRGFVDEEELNPARSVVLSYAYWQKLGGNWNIVGSLLRLAQGDFTIVGVMPEGFTGTDLMLTAVFLPTGATDVLWARPGEPPPKTLTDRGARSFMLFGRLKDGVTPQAAREGVKLVSDKFRVADPHEPKGRELIITPLQRFAYSNRPSNFLKSIMPVASLAMALSVTVLAVACLNLANMLLARGAARRKEIAVRLAIGASRTRIVRQLLCEGLLLAAVGSIAGMLIAIWSTTALASFMNSGLGSEAFRVDTTPDLPIVGALVGLCCLATAFFALGPAWKLASLDVNSDLKQHGSVDAGESWGRANLKTILVVGQLALSLALLVAAALFTRSAFEAMHVDSGFTFGGQFVARIDTGVVSYPETRARQIFNDAEERIGALPGVESVSSAMFAPFAGSSWSRQIQIGGAPAADESARSFKEGKPLGVLYNVVSVDYFKTLGAPLLRGREFNRSESVAAPPFPIAIISQDVAEQLWPGEDPVGRTIQYPAEGKNPPKIMQVVGVAPRILWDLFDKHGDGMLVTPRGQDFQSAMYLHVRVLPNAELASIMDLVRHALSEIDPEMPLVEMKPMKMMHEEGMSMRVTKIGAMLFGAFGAVAILLSFLGVYGLKSYSVARRTREIGIRMALGATARDVVRMIVGEGARMAAIGLALGLILAVAVGKLAGRFLFGVTGGDPVTFTLIPIALGIVALIASWLPARRATRVNPMTALRWE
jgi:putative ABC transport system permease protein